MGSEPSDQLGLSNGKAKELVAGSESMEAIEQDQKVDPLNENSSNLDFENSEPLREDQVQNAVKFLSHPKVRGSPIIHRRTFLEKKGLTKEEIDEAFSRVPDPPSSAGSSQSPVTKQDPATSEGQVQLSQATKAQISSQISKPHPAPSLAGPTVVTQQTSHFKWSNILYAVGLLAASGAGTGFLFQKAFIPKFKTWLRKVVLDDEDTEKARPLRPTAIEEAASAAKFAATAAADVAKLCQENTALISEERKYFDSFSKVLETQMEEMKSMTAAIQNIVDKVDLLSSKKITDELLDSTGSSNILRNPSFASNGDHKIPYPASKDRGNDLVGAHEASVRTTSASVPFNSATASYSMAEVRAMLERGEKPPNVKEVNDMPPNPNQPPSIPRLLPRPKPWEVNQHTATSSYELKAGSASHTYSNVFSNFGRQSTPFTTNTPEHWGEQKSVKITEIDPGSDDSRPIFNDTNKLPSWVPPPPPPVSMPEAAAAIWRQKSKEHVVVEQGIDNHMIATESSVSYLSSFSIENKEVPGDVESRNLESVAPPHLNEDGSSFSSAVAAEHEVGMNSIPVDVRE